MKEVGTKKVTTMAIDRDMRDANIEQAEQNSKKNKKKWRGIKKQTVQIGS